VLVRGMDRMDRMDGMDRTEAPILAIRSILSRTSTNTVVLH
jgi:hypothetical protein